MNEVVRPGDAAGPTQRRISEARSLLSEVVETHALPVERLKGQPKGEVVSIKKIGDTIAALEKVDDHYEVAVFDGQGNITEISVDPTSYELGDNLSSNYIKTRNSANSGIDPVNILERLGFDRDTALDGEAEWYAKANRVSSYMGGMTSEDQIRKIPPFALPTGQWEMGVTGATWDQGRSNQRTETVFYFVNGKKFYVLDVKPNSIKKLGFDTTPDRTDPDRIDLAGSLKLTQQSTLFRINDKTGKELVSYSGTEAIVDPANPNNLYFINTGQVYRLDISGVADRSSRPTLEKQIAVEGPQQLQFDPNGNFLIIKSQEDKLHVVDKGTGDAVKSFDNVKGPVLVDSQGDIIYVDSEKRLREVQTNFQAIPAGGSESAQERRAEQLRLAQERFANLELGQMQKRKGDMISEEDVANTLRETISRQVTEQITTSDDPQILEDIMDRLQGLKADPANTAYGEVVDEFIGQAREKLSTVMLGQFDTQLGSFEQALGEIKSVGDTIGVDEQFAKLLELRQKIDITDPVKRREVEKQLQDLQSRKDGLVFQYQGELVEAANQALPGIGELFGETGSLQELTYLSTSSQIQQFEMMLANIKDPAVRRELRGRYSKLRGEQREKLETIGRESAEQDRLRYAQVMEEAREDLASLREQLAQTSDAREVDRFGRNPLVTVWKAKLLALPPELREIEEKRLEIILGARKKDMEHRRELGAVGEGDELKFGNVTFPVYKEPPRLWQPKFTPRGGEFSPWADLTFEDQQGRVFTPQAEPGGKVVVSADLNDEKTKAVVERYKRQAEEYFREIKRKVPDFDEHWRITPYHMEKLEEIAEALNLQLANHRGALILQGEAGSGKNVAVDMLANLSNREVVSILCNENSVKEDLTYEFYYDPEKGTYKLPSKLVEALQTPGSIILFDEINALKPGMAKMLNSLFDYRRRIFLAEGGTEREIIADPTVLFVCTMNPQNYGGVTRLSPEVKSRARVIDIDYPPFEERRGGRTYYRSDEAEMLAGYMDELSELKQPEFRQVWDYVINRDESNGGDVILEGNPGLEMDVRRVYDVIRVANTLRDMYEAYQVGDSNEPMDFPTSLREVTDIVMEMNHRQGVKRIIKRVIIPKIDDRRQKKMVEATIDGVLPEE